MPTLNDVQSIGDVEQEISVLPGKCTPSRRIMYIWQRLLMLMAWSWVLFLMAVTFHITRSLPPFGTIEGQRMVRGIHRDLSSSDFFYIAICMLHRHL